MNWPGPTFTDSGGFQVMSLGVGFKKVLAMDADTVRCDDVIAAGKDRLAHVDEDGVTFKSHIDGIMHRFTPEVSMQVQHQIGADIIFAFDECTTLLNTREYQERSVARTHAWAGRCVAEHERLTERRGIDPTRRSSGWCRARSTRICDGRPPATSPVWTWTVSGSAAPWRRSNWAPSSAGSPRNCPRAGPGICWASASPTTCSSRWRPARTRSTASRHRGWPATVPSTTRGRFNLTSHNRDFAPIDEDCDCYTCAHYTRAYLHHLFKAKEMLASTLATIHNERFIVRLVDHIRASIVAGDFDDLRDEFLGRLGPRAASGEP